jgi:deoxyribonucleoside regulator
MGYHDDVRLLIEMAHMYYGDGATQDEIAKKFNISRSLVSKYMSKARDMGLVEITIHDENLHPYKQLEEKLRKAF